MGHPKTKQTKQIPLIVDFKDVVKSKLTTKEIGGKGLSLGRMTNLFENFVPFGCCVTIRAYKEHVLHQCRIDMSCIQSAGEATLKSVAQKIRDTPLSTGTRAEIRAWLRSRQVTKNTRFAVRSSGTLEDGSQQSFAGQYDTILNVLPNLVYLERALKSCWASLWSAHSRSYLRSTSSSLSFNIPLMSVVLQLMLNPVCAGTMFTINPMNANVNEIVVQSVWGLGEGQVSGMYTGHTATIDWRNGKIVSKTSTPQLKKLVCVDTKESENIKEVSTSESEQRASPLTLKTLHHLGSLALKVASHYNIPQDLEWALCKDSRLYLLQSRPVTKVSFPRDSGRWFQIHGSEVGPLGESIGYKLSLSLSLSFFSSLYNNNNNN